MPIKKILKILGFILVPLLPMAVAVYFLFPYLNEEKHKEISEKYSDEFVIGDTTDVEIQTSAFSPESGEDVPVKDIGKDYANLEDKVARFKTKIENLNATKDSLTTVNDSLENQLAQRSSDAEKAAEAASEKSNKKLAENVKSLLDLDVESLSPIINKMSDKQLVRIFNAGSGLQRKKLVRSLEADRAAKLMTEVL